MYIMSNYVRRILAFGRLSFGQKRVSFLSLNWSFLDLIVCSKEAGQNDVSLHHTLLIVLSEGLE
jgi:hypothetical protein